MPAPPASVRHRRILALAIPAIVTLVADPLLGFVDTAVVGRVGAEQLGALGLAVAVLAALTWIFNFLVYGTTSAVAHAVGAGDRTAAGRHVAHAAQVAVGLGVVVGLLVAIAAPVLLQITGAVPELVAPAASYLRIRSLGLPFILLDYVGHGAFRGVSDTRTPLVIVTAANLLNGALDVVLVLGLGWGLDGAAWATVVAEVVVALLFALLLRRAGLPLTGHGRPRRREIGAMLVVSRDLFVRTGALLLGLLAVTSAAARIGAVTAAAHQVLWQTWIMVSFFIDGFAIAGQTLVGTAIGRGDPDEARAVARDLLRWALGGGAAAAVALLAGAELVPRLLTDDAAVLATVAAAWWLAAGGHVLNGTVFVLDGVFMGANDFAYLRTWSAVGAVVAAVLAQVVVASDGGILGLWWALQAMMLVRLVSLLVRFRGTAWLQPASR